MSSNMDESDVPVRVTRNSMKRIASNESLNSVGSRVDTPTSQLRIRKKLELISEDGAEVRPSFDSPRKTRKGSVEPISVASPLRRTTRAMSNERDMTASPLTLRSTRRSNIIDSDTDDMQNATLTPSRAKELRKKRQSAITSPNIENIPEESASEKEGEDEAKADKSLDLSNDLELRTRSISKSPQVNGSSKTSLDGSKTDFEAETKKDETVEENLLEFSQVEEEVNPSKFFKNRASKESETEKKALIDESMSECNEVSLIKPFSNIRRLAQPEKTTFDGVLDRLEKSNVKPQTASSPIKKTRFLGFEDKTEIINESLPCSPGGTPVRGRRSIHEKNSQKKAKILDEVEAMLEDFVSDGTEVSTPKTKTKPVFKKTPKPSVSDNKSLICDDPMDISQDIVESDMEISVMDSSKTKTDFKNISIDEGSSKKNKSFSKYLEQLTKSSPREKMEKRKTMDTSLIIDANTSQEKKKLSQSWSQSVTKQLESSIDQHSKSPRPEIVETADQRVKGYSSDESEEDDVNEKNSFVDDEAEVGSNESITESELQYMKENEIPHEGESIGSDDSVIHEESSAHTDDEYDDDDSFIDKDEEMSNGYSMDSFEEELEEQLKETPLKGKRKSRLILPSDSEEEPADIKSTSQAPEEKAVTSKSLRKSLIDQAKDAVASPKNTSTRKSIVPASDSEEDEIQAIKSKTPRKSSGLSKVEHSKEPSSDHEEKATSFRTVENDNEEEVEKPKSARKSLNKSQTGEKSLTTSKSLRNSIIASSDQEVEEENEDEEEVEKPKSARKSLNKSQIEAPVSGKKLRNSIIASSDQEVEEKSKTPRKSASFREEENEDEEEVEKSKSARKSLNKSQTEAPVSSKKLRKSLDPKAAEENSENQEKSKLKRKRKHEAEDANLSIVLKSKRMKLIEDDANDSETMHMDNVSGIAELFDADDTSDSEPKHQEKPKMKRAPVEADVINKCNEIMDIYNENKKKALALKREKKLAKQLKKKREAAQAGGENLDSSGSNKENGIKKKKKNKSKEKKQKLVSDLPDETKEDISTTITKMQEKLELKRQRKLEKKLAKQQRESEGTEDKVIDTVAKEAKKKAKKPKIEDNLEIEMEEPKAPKVKKAKKTPVEEVVEVAAVIEEVPMKKKKKSLENRENLEDPEEVVPEKKKKNLKKVVEDENVVEASEKKKNKKRKIEEVVEDEAPKSKKLNVLKQIEDPMQFQTTSHFVSATTKEKDFTVPLSSNKLKKVIPAVVDNKKKKLKNLKKQRKVIAEPTSSLPRPVWTTSGIFIEQPTTPAYKFTSTKYVPIRASASASTKFGVVAFESNQKKSKRSLSENQPEDFRSRYLAQTKGRDGSMKNMRGLLPSTKSF